MTSSIVYDGRWSEDHWMIKMEECVVDEYLYINNDELDEIDDDVTNKSKISAPKNGPKMSHR